MLKTPQQRAFDVRLNNERRQAFTHWLCTELLNAEAARPIPVSDVRYWWTLYEQGRTRSTDAPWQDAADLTSFLGTEKVDALLARMMQTIFVDPIYTVEGWGTSAKKAPFVEDFHQWAAESEGLQAFVERALLSSLIEPRGVLEVFEDTTTRVVRRNIKAQVQTAPDGSWVMDAETMQPALMKDEQGNFVEAEDPMLPAADTVVDEVQRVRTGPGYRVLNYENFLVLPAHAREKADIFGYAKRFTRRIDQLKEAAKQGMYEGAAVEALHDGPDVTSDMTVAGEARPMADQTGPTAEKELWEVQVLHDLDGKGLRWYVCTVHVPTRTLLRLKFDDINQGRYILFVPYPRPDRSHEGYSVIGHKLITTIEEHTAWRNMGADRAALEIAAPIKRAVTALWDPDLQPMGPRAVIDVRDMREVESMQIAPQTDVGLKREQECLAASERLIGVNDVALGQSSGPNQTLGELQIRTQQSFVRMDLVIKNFQEPMEELGQIRHVIWQRAVEDSEKYGGTQAPSHLFEGLDERGGDPSKANDGTITPEMLDGTFRFKPRGSTESADKSKLRGDYIQFLQALAIAFKTWPVLMQTVGMNPQAAKSAIEQMLRLFNIPDKQAWLGNIEQMMQQPNPMMGGGMPGMPPMGGPPGLPPGMPPQIAQMMGQPPEGAPPQNG